MRRALAIALALVVVAFAVAARAQSGNRAAEAKRRLDAGNKLYLEGRYDDAVRELRAGYALDARPDFLYALGQAERKRGDCKAAVRYYQAFVDTGQSPQRTVAVLVQIDRLQAGDGGRAGDAAIVGGAVVAARRCGATAAAGRRAARRRAAGDSAGRRDRSGGDASVFFFLILAEALQALVGLDDRRRRRRGRRGRARRRLDPALVRFDAAQSRGRQGDGALLMRAARLAAAASASALALIAMLGVGGCKSQSGAVELTIVADPSLPDATVADIGVLGISLSGAVTTMQSYLVNQPFSSGRQERLAIRPSVTSGSLTIAVLAGSSAGTPLAYGQTTVTLKADGPVAAQVTLTGDLPPPGGGDMGVGDVPDLATGTSGPTIQLIAGQLGGMGNVDATGSAARFNNPRALAYDGGNLYVTDLRQQLHPQGGARHRRRDHLRGRGAAPPAPSTAPAPPRASIGPTAWSATAPATSTSPTWTTHHPEDRHRHRRRHHPRRQRRPGRQQRRHRRRRALRPPARHRRRRRRQPLRRRHRQP